MDCAALVLDSSWRVLPSLDIEVRCSYQGLDRRGPIVTRGGNGKYHWIVLPARYQVGPGQSQLPLIDAFFPDLLHCYFVDL